MKKPEPIFREYKAIHGEGPVWCPESNTLYWVDISACGYYKAILNEKKVSFHDVGQPLGVMALREKGGFIMGLRDGVGLWDEKKNEMKMIFNLEVERARFNDGAVDTKGRFMAGTMDFDGDKSIGEFYSINEQKRTKLLKEHMYIPNGLDWMPDDPSKFFLTDTPKHVIYAYDYNTEDGSIHNERNFIEFGNDEYPDGMCIDMEGNFWVAMWGQKKVIRFDKNGQRKEEIFVPVLHPTSCCFGGEKMNMLFITTSQRDLDEKQKKEYPFAGNVFVMETGTQGQKQRRYKG